MTTMEIIMACVGLLLCAVIFSVVFILIMLVIWWVFRTDMNIEIDSSEWEEDQ
jgi:hypothetical protein